MVFSDDFDGGQAVLGGVGAALSGVTTTEPVQSYAGLGSSGNQFGGDFLYNQTGGLPTIGTSGMLTTLTLTNLPAHNSIDLDFLLATINSWDGIDGANGVTGDYFNVRVDGVEIFEATFAQQSGTPANAYQAPSGGQLDPGSNLWRRSVNIADGAYDMGLDPILSNIAHSSSTLVIDFFADGPGWQGERDFLSIVGEPDEAWAIDNLRVSIHMVPEPSSFLLSLGLVIAGLAQNTRRR